MARNGGQTVAGNDIDIAVGVGKRIERRGKLDVAAECGIYQRIIGISRQLLIRVTDAGFDALPPRIAGILEEATAGDRRRHVQDVVLIDGAENAGVPVDLARTEKRNVEIAANASFDGA